jgi:alpha-tubulin suppressor-like RCC1 family protein
LLSGCGHSLEHEQDPLEATLREQRREVFSTSPAISSGAYHTVVLKEHGTLWAWGDNSHGQLGDGTTVARSTPVQVTSLSQTLSVFTVTP